MRKPIIGAEPLAGLELLGGHWSYDLNRHLGLLRAFKGELAAYRATELNRNELGGVRPQP